MRLIFTSRNISEINLLRGLLESEGIPCQTRNEYNSTISLLLEFMPQLYVANDEDFEAAQRVLSTYRPPDALKLEPWVCPKCGETNEGQFGACWKCDYEIEESEGLVA